MNTQDFLDYASTALGPKEVKQFVRAIENPLTGFHDRFVQPQFYRPLESTYLALDYREETPGRNHRCAAMIQDDPSLMSAMTYFTNPLEIAPDPTFDQNGKEVWQAPMDRVVWGSYQAFTYEFDENNLAFFQRQLSWLRSSNNYLDCPMGELYRACSEYVDFEGITVAWSGNKSFHIHIVFSTAQAREMGIESFVRDGLHAHWDRLLATVMDKLAPGDVQPDLGMWQPEKFRRLPQGVRQLSKPNILGMPAGTLVRQVTVWEKFRDRAPKGSATSFFDPTMFVQRFKSGSHTAKALTFLPSAAELEYAATKMKLIYDGKITWPEFAGWSTDNKGDIRAQFYNMPGDKRPSSFMDLEYKTVSINGKSHLTPQTAPKLPKSLGEMLVDWIGEYTAFNSVKRSPYETAFANKVTDAVSAKSAIRDVLLSTIRDNKRSFVCAPEGISKTSSLFENHHRIDAWLRADGSPNVMFAFADYEAAREKAEHFNKLQNGFHAIVIESFDRAYKTACEAVGVTALTLEDAIRFGDTNLWDSMTRMQPEVRDHLVERHLALWKSVGRKTPVFFTVHAVAHRWHITSPTRLMWSPSFWLQSRDKEHTRLCRSETAIGLLVHDEIKAENIVCAYRAEVVDWVDTMIASDLDVWQKSSVATARYESYHQFLAKAGAPLVNGERYPITFEIVQDIFEFAGHEWDHVITADSGEYGAQNEDSPYRARIGQQWRVQERRWPEDITAKVVVLTTESVPLALVRKSLIDWTIFDLDTPHIERDAVEVQALKGITGKSLPTVVAGWKRTIPNLFVISNRVAHMTETMPHARARGSNALMGRDIMQTMTFVTPDEFEALEALNAWTGRDCLIRHRHIDEFNQTAGRNLGFRKRGNPRHILLVNLRLFGLLVGEPRARARYEMKVAVSRTARRNALAQPVRAKFSNDNSTDESKIAMAAMRARLVSKR